MLDAARHFVDHRKARPQFLGLGLPEHQRAADTLGPAIIDLRVKKRRIDSPAAEENDRLALDQRRQVIPINPRDRPHLGLLCLSIASIVAANI